MIRMSLMGLALVALSGCASVNEQGMANLNAGKIDLAERNFKHLIQSGEPAGWNNLGLVYERKGRLSEAVQAAQQNLIRLNLVVPGADLAPRVMQAPTSNWTPDNTARAIEAFGEGWSKGAAQRPLVVPQTQQPAPSPPRKVTCESRQVGFGQFAKVETVCK